MNKTMKEKYQELLNLIESLDGFDDYAERMRVEKAMQAWCSDFDIFQGHKHALLLATRDQMENHPEDNSIDDIQEVIDLLKPRKHFKNLSEKAQVRAIREHAEYLAGIDWAKEEYIPGYVQESLNMEGTLADNIIDNGTQEMELELYDYLFNEDGSK